MALSSGGNCYALLEPTVQHMPVEFAVCHSWRHKDFESEGCQSSEPKHNETQAKRFISKCIRTVHRPGDDINISSGAEMCDTAGLCPPFSPSNSNAFGSTFGIEFKAKDGQLYIRPFQPTKSHAALD